jgi:NhaP-type Na+/H+ or K+/H+ antiporter
LHLSQPQLVCALQVGADEKLSSVIDGESLVNDGSALVIFLVLQQFVQGASLTASEVRAACVQTLLYSVILLGVPRSLLCIPANQR